jgi:hypothetical protein
MEQEQGETNMVEIKEDMIKYSTGKEISKNEYRNWTNFVQQHNHDNPNDQICYEVVWKDDIYNVKIIELDVDNEG